MGSRTLQRLQKKAATYTGFASPGCATPSGFLNLLTCYSALNLSDLVSCQQRPWVSAFRGFPSRVVGTSLDVACPPCRFNDWKSSSARTYVLPARLRGFTHPGSPCKAGRSYPVTASRSSPNVRLSEVSPARPRPRASTRPPLMGFHNERELSDSRTRTPNPNDRMIERLHGSSVKFAFGSLFRVSKNRQMGPCLPT
jgi:hypothetical protein